MKTNQLFMCVATLIFFISISVAQEKSLTDSQREKLKDHFKEYYEKLALTEEQQTLFKKITIKYAIQIKALKNSNKPYSDKADAFKTILDTKNKEMKILLFTEQFKIYKDSQESSIEKLKIIKKNIEKLELTEKQESEFREITKKYLLQMIGLKNSNKSNAAKADELKWILDAKNEEMKVLLTDKQYKTYKKTQQKRMKKLKKTT